MAVLIQGEGLRSWEHGKYPLHELRDLFLLSDFVLVVYTSSLVSCIHTFALMIKRASHVLVRVFPECYR